MEPAQATRLIVDALNWYDYDPERGVLVRKCKTRSDAYDEVNPKRSSVYLCGKYYDYAMICWIVYYERLPNGIVDHKNRNKIDHTITNLREATLTQNQQNKASYGRYAKGVTWRDRIEKPFQAKIRTGGKRIHLGSFATEEEAAKAYREAALKYHGEFACLD